MKMTDVIKNVPEIKLWESRKELLKVNTEIKRIEQELSNKKAEKEKLKLSLKKEKKATNTNPDRIKQLKNQLEVVNSRITNLEKGLNAWEKERSKKEKVVEAAQEKADPKVVKELLNFVNAKWADQEITVHFLMENFESKKEEVSKILGSSPMMQALNQAYRKASDEEKSEIALLYDKMGVDLNLNLDEYTRKEQEILRAVKGELAVLKTEITSYQRYNAEKLQTTTTGAAESESKFDKALANKTIDLIYKQLASMDKNMKLKLNDGEKKMMKGFVDFVNDVSKDPETKQGGSWGPIEMRILKYILENPTRAYRNSATEWVAAMKEIGISVKEKGSLTALGDKLDRKGASFLRDFAALFMTGQDVLTQKLANHTSNFHNYINELIKNGGFEGMVNNWESEILRAKDWEKKIGNIDPRQIEELKKMGISDPERQIRLNSLLNLDNVKDDQIFDLLLDFNLDGMLSQGDVEQKSALQVQEVLSDLKISKSDALKNLLAFANKGRAKDNQITKENLTSIANFDEVQARLKNPSFDISAILKYGADAVQKFLDAQPDVTKMEILKKQRLAENTEEIRRQIDNRIAQIKRLQTLRQNAKENLGGSSAKAALTEHNISEEIQALSDAQLQQELDALQKFKTPQGKEDLEMGARQMVEAQLLSFKDNGVAVGVGVPLETVLKGLSFNVGAGVGAREKGRGNAGLNLTWNGSVDLGKWWRGSASLSAGTTWAVLPFAAAQAEVKKEFWRDETLKILWEQRGKKVSVWAHAMATPAGVSWGVSGGVERNKENDRLRDMEVIRRSTTDILSQILASSVVDGKINITQDTLKNWLDQENNEYTKNTEKPDLNLAIDNLTRYLSVYNGIEASDQNKAKIIAELSEAYALAYGNQKAKELNDAKGILGTGYHLSGVKPSISFINGVVPIVWLLKFQQHKYNATVDSAKSLDNAKETIYGTKFNKEVEGNSVEEKLSNLNALLGFDSVILDGGKNNFIIDTDKLGNYQIKIDPSMKGNIFMADGKIIVHKSTPIRLAQFTGVQWKTDVLNIGAETTAHNALSLNDLKWDVIVQSAEKVPARIEALTKEKFDLLLEALKKQAGEKFPKNLNLTFESVQSLDFNGLKFDPQKPQNLKIDTEGNLSLVERERGTQFQILLETKEDKRLAVDLDLSGETQTKLIALYGHLSNLKTNALANAVHNIWTDLKRLRAAATIEDKSAEMIQILTKIQRQLDFHKEGKEIFAGVIETLNSSNDPQEKELILTALEGIFSRTHNVKGAGAGKYQLEYGAQSDKNTFGNVINHTKEAILRKMDSLGHQNRVDYKTLFDKMNASAKIEAPQIEAELRENVIGYNFGNPNDLIRPVLNPHVVKGVDTLSETQIPESVKSQLLNELFTNDSSLVDSLLTNIATALGKGKDEIKNLITSQADILNNSLDIWGKKVKFNAKFETAFYAQCVNHMVLISDIGVMIEGAEINQYAQQLESKANIKIAGVEARGKEQLTTKEAEVAVGFTVDMNKNAPSDNTTTTPGEIEEPIDNTNTTPGEYEGNNPPKTPDIPQNPTPPEAPKGPGEVKGETYGRD